MKKNDSGQMLLVAVLLLAVLIVAIPALIFINHHSATHGMSSQKRLKSRTVSEEGLAFVMHQLALPGNWPFSNGTCAITCAIPTALGFDGSQSFPSAQGGGSFKVFTTVPPAAGVQGVTGFIENYQVEVIVRSFDKLGNPIAGSSVGALVSQRTVGVNLQTGLSAGAAMQMQHIPIEPGHDTFLIQRGPIVLYDPGTWHIAGACPDINTMGSTHNCDQNPRKFSIGGITSENLSDVAYHWTLDSGASLKRCPNSPTDPNCLATTDNKEYWAFANLGFPPVLDDAITANSYLQSAVSEVGITPPQCYLPPGPVPATSPPAILDQTWSLTGTNVLAGSPSHPCLNGPDCGYFDTTQPNICPSPTDIVAFGQPNVGVGPWAPTVTAIYKVPTATSVIYVNGNAAVQTVELDFKQGGVNGGGAFIVTGNLDFLPADNASPLGYVITDGRIPPTNYLDACYYNSAAPCHGDAQCNTFRSDTWTANAIFSLRGFLWVKGNLHGWPGAYSARMVLSGVARVDGTLTLDTNGTALSAFALYYDDEVNRKIRTANLEFQIDSTTSLP